VDLHAHRPSRLRREPRPALDALDVEPAREQRPRRLSRGAADLEQTGARRERGEFDEVLVEPGRVLWPRRRVRRGSLVENAQDSAAATS
jgi:hypothetical protein